MRLASTLALAGMLVAPAAVAQELRSKEPPDPTVAAQWSVLAPLACGLVGTAIGVATGQRGTNLWFPMLGGLGVGLGTVGAGQVYAGDPSRGIAVGAVAYPAVGLGALLGGGVITPLLGLSTGGRIDAAGQTMLGAAIGGALAAAGYGAFAAYDAQWYAKRVAAQRSFD